jgi:hypothetical protein
MLSYLSQLNNEDSTYTMIVPTNEAWDTAYRRVKPYYNYPSKGIYNPDDSLGKYFTKLAMVRDLVFSHTVQKSVTDSLVSTTKGVFYNPFETILSEYSGWDDAEECSNGGIFVVDELKHNPWDSWHEEIIVEAEDLRSLIEDKEQPRKIFYTKLGSNDSLYTKVSGGAYLEMQRTRSDNPKIGFNVWNTLSGKYRLKIVFLPQKLATTKDKTILPNYFYVICRYVNDNGKIHDGVSFGEYELMNDPTKIDTVDVGELDLQYCVYGQERVGLEVELKNDFSDEGTYSGTFLIDCIILEPVKE